MIGVAIYKACMPEGLFTAHQISLLLYWIHCMHICITIIYIHSF